VSDIENLDFAARKGETTENEIPFQEKPDPEKNSNHEKRNHGKPGAGIARNPIWRRI
jgi:hypothetical protein